MNARLQPFIMTKYYLQFIDRRYLKILKMFRDFIILGNDDNNT